MDSIAYSRFSVSGDLRRAAYSRNQFVESRKRSTREKIRIEGHNHIRVGQSVLNILSALHNRPCNRRVILNKLRLRIRGLVLPSTAAPA